MVSNFYTSKFTSNIRSKSISISRGRVYYFYAIKKEMNIAHQSSYNTFLCIKGPEASTAQKYRIYVTSFFFSFLCIFIRNKTSIAFKLFKSEEGQDVYQQSPDEEERRDQCAFSEGCEFGLYQFIFRIKLHLITNTI